MTAYSKHVRGLALIAFWTRLSLPRRTYGFLINRKAARKTLQPFLERVASLV